VVGRKGSPRLRGLGVVSTGLESGVVSTGEETEELVVGVVEAIGKNTASLDANL